MYWPNPIKDIIKWFIFSSIIDHTANILEPNKALIPSLLRVFAMFQLYIFYDTHNEEYNVLYSIAINCSNYNKETGLNFKNTTIEEMITKFV